MGKNISKIILENIDYEAYAKEEEKAKKNYYDRLCGNITTEMRNNFTKLKDIINDGEDKVEYDGFYIPEKFVNIFTNRDMRHHLNPYMDLTVADMFNMIDDNTTIEDVLQGLFDEYESESALSWGDNFLEMLKGSLNESVKVKRKPEEEIINKIIDRADEIYKGYGYESDLERDYIIDGWKDGDEFEIIVDISWGDWKHDHIMIEDLFNQVFREFNIDYTEDEEVTEEDGSDAYSATHTFYFKPEVEFDSSKRHAVDNDRADMIKFMCRLDKIPCSDEFINFVLDKGVNSYSGEILKNLKAEFDKKN